MENADVTILLGGDEKFPVKEPTIANAPRTISSAITALKVNIEADNATIKIGGRIFKKGQTVDFTHPVTFTVTTQDGAMKAYTVAITPYNAVTNPYGIYTAKHLADVANGLSDSFLLKNDINLPDVDKADEVDTGISDYADAGWRPLGPFTGTFDGGDFSINNFYTRRAVEHSVGLFGRLERGGTIKNLGVNGTAIKWIKGEPQYAGILVGYSAGIIDKCYATGKVTASSSYAGGLVGYNEGDISNSYAAGDAVAHAASSYVGGLVGHNAVIGHISNSYATGAAQASQASYVGGLVGHNAGHISKSYATGNVASPSSYVGGLVGYNEVTGRISNSYATGTVSSPSPSSPPSSYVGGLVGHNAGHISKSYATGNVDSFSFSSYVGGLVGKDQGRYREDTCENCYYNSDAIIKIKNQIATPDDASISSIQAKTKAEMQTDAFKNSLNEKGSVWGRDDVKNDKLPYIIGVGVGGRKL